MPTELPTRPEDFSLDILNCIIADHSPEAQLAGFEITEHHLWGRGQVSSAGRVIIKLTYAKPSENLPQHIVVKVAKAALGSMGAPNQDGSGSPQLYLNEVNIYTKLRPSEFMETPMCLGG